MTQRPRPFAPGRRRLLAGAAGVLLLSGCSGLGTSPPRLYVLRPALPPATDLPAARWQLAVAVPDTVDALNTARIALSPSSDRIDYYSDAAWVDRMPVLLQRALIDAFEDSGKLAGVGRDTAELRPDFLLEIEIRHFEARYDAGPDQAPTVSVGLEARLTRLPGRVIMGSLSSSREVGAARNDLDSIVAAFDTASGACIGQILAWSLRTPLPG